MTISNVRNNLQSAPNFGVTLVYKPKSPANYYGKESLSGIDAFKLRSVHYDIDANTFLEGLLSLLRTGKITRTKGKGKKIEGYSDIATFKYGSDTLKLATGSTTPHAAPSKIVISHGTAGCQGESIFSRYQSNATDAKFDETAKALQELPAAPAKPKKAKKAK